jgi:hypothetical protein
METIRTYKERDLPDLKQMFDAMSFQGENFPYEIVQGMNGFVSLIQTNDDDQAKIAMLARLSAEILIFNDPAWLGPRGRWDKGIRLYRILEKDLRSRGIAQVWGRIPEEIAAGFGRRIRGIGFKREEFPVFVKEFNDGT